MTDIERIKELIPLTSVKDGLLYDIHGHLMDIGDDDIMDLFVLTRNAIGPLLDAAERLEECEGLLRRVRPWVHIDHLDLVDDIDAYFRRPRGDRAAEGGEVKYFFDTEFIEDGKTIDLLSIGIVAEDGRELYEINADCDWHKADDWVKSNVIAHLPPKRVNYSDPSVSPRLKEESRHFNSHEGIARAIREFVGTDKPEFWAYYADYDWVVLCQLFGRMIDLPKGWPMYCRDVKQLCDSMGNPKLPEQTSKEHHALEDARWTKQAHEFLIERLKRSINGM